jgi:ferrochelatase
MARSYMAGARRGGDRPAPAGNFSMCSSAIGFVCEHVEILYDVDIVFKRQAESLGVRLERIEMLNTAPRMMAGLAELVRRTAQEKKWL